ncbi:MAG: putative metal-dependent hydrolase [Calditrichaeota bacterium]|nr:MAG: putative metal-dependent hydrolase [Calditrichota bacterium]MBL1206478.1 putative metal-dependent hydrolase [Calditrichota bacterium]NOG46305.1 putative metal-dependent hydrolase [Calditrichota bacterium]
MTNFDLRKLQYPIGEFNKPDVIDELIIKKWIADIENFPDNVESLTTDLNVDQLNWKYRPGGWTIKQVVHHCSDSHINSIIRFKLALTEDQPQIRPYFENRWAELHDSLDNDISDSLALLKALHSKWAKLLKSLSNIELDRKFIHPEHVNAISLKENIGLYAWHCNHHLQHIRQALKHKNSF